MAVRMNDGTTIGGGSHVVSDQELEMMREAMRRRESGIEEYERRMNDRYIRTRGYNPRDKEEMFMLRLGEAVDDMHRRFKEGFLDMEKALRNLAQENINLSAKIDELEETIKELSYYDEQPSPEVA